MGSLSGAGPWTRGLFGGFLGDLGKPLGGRVEASFKPLGASWGPLGAEGWVFQFVVSLRSPSWARLGSLLGCLVRLLGRLGGPLGPSWAALGPSGGPLGAPSAALGPSGGPLEPSWGRRRDLWGRLGAVLGASRAVLERRKGEKAKMPKKTSNKQMKINDFGLAGPSWVVSWAVRDAVKTKGRI